MKSINQILWETIQQGITIVQTRCYVSVNNSFSSTLGYVSPNFSYTTNAEKCALAGYFNVFFNLTCYFNVFFKYVSYQDLWQLGGHLGLLSIRCKRYALTHNYPRDLGSICFVKKRKIHFRILSDLRIQSWIFFKKLTLRGRGKDFPSVLYAVFALEANHTQGWHVHPSLAASYWKSNKIIVYQFPAQLRTLCFWPMKY